jgi:hypothetical protein
MQVLRDIYKTGNVGKQRVEFEISKTLDPLIDDTKTILK